MGAWAVDVGTTNTVLARWDESKDRPRIVRLASVERRVAEDGLERPSVVPSATEVVWEPDAGARWSETWPFRGRVFWGRTAYIGQPALDRSAGESRSGFVPLFKPWLAHAPLTTLVRGPEGRALPAREVARRFARELLAEVRRSGEGRIDDLVVTAPSESFESYRAELRELFGGLGVGRVRFLDEPVAAAIGYGIPTGTTKDVLVFDFGGGTMHAAVVRLTGRGVEAGAAVVLAKAGRPIGGTLVDRWLLEWFCGENGFDITDGVRGTDASFWANLMLAESCRVKEALLLDASASFHLIPPEEHRSFERRLRGDAIHGDVTREALVSLLEARGLYGAMDGLLAEALGAAGCEVEEVLVVGGSTLLPGVWERLASRFDRSRIRAFQPFEAVALGAATWAAGRVRTQDFIVHDYAFPTWTAQTHEPVLNLVIPRGTRFPTAPDFWRRRLVPTCATGLPERQFRLEIQEVGSAHGGDRIFAWDLGGRLHSLRGPADVHAGEQGGERTPDGRLVVSLNGSDPVLGVLDPPHAPSDRTARLEVAFGVNAERWLIATVDDLKTGRRLMDQRPVVRLL